MHNRRTFFQSLIKTAAIIALAPRLAFQVKDEVFNLQTKLKARWVEGPTIYYIGDNICRVVTQREFYDYFFHGRKPMVAHWDKENNVATVKEYS